ncbi:MAG: phosphoesterase [Sulfuricurvum sp. PC08-66]|nr:MAG: phosphoesterase [Sulfuricurvum sp. PC08-66]
MPLSTTLFHLSHIDLDGYSAQLVTQELFKETHYFNANYGPEVLDRLEQILKSVDAMSTPALILISDLNLTLSESKMIDAAVATRPHVSLLLLDHHGSGKESAEIFAWYTLDTTRCATQITYDYALAHWNIPQERQAWLAPYVAIVNAVDLWRIEQESNFEYGKVCMRLVTETRELNRYMFDTQDRDYKFALLTEAAHHAQLPNAPIALDDAIHAMKKRFFKRDIDGTLDSLATRYIVERIGTIKEQLLVSYRGYTGLLTYALGNTSILGNGILKAYRDIDFVMDVGARGTVSLRADFGVDVSVIAKEIADGGGHPNASGGRLQGFKEQYQYTKVKSIVEKLLLDKEPTSQLPMKG